MKTPLSTLHLVAALALTVLVFATGSWLMLVPLAVVAGLFFLAVHVEARAGR